MFSLGIEFRSKTKQVLGFISRSINLVHLMHALILLVNDNCVDNNLKEILMYVYFERL